MTDWWRSRKTWLIAGAGVVVAGTATVALLTQTTAGACAAPPAALAPTSGQATYYAANGGGNCSFDQVSSPLVVALGNAEYAGGAACGGYLDVKGPKGSVRVKVTDRCPECAAGHIDLSREAFAKIGNVVDGIIKVTYSPAVSPSVPGPVTARVKEGSSQYWLALRFDNTGNPLSGAEIQSGGAWKTLARTDYNYWIAQSGAGTGPFNVRLTDIAGRRTTLNGIALKVGTVQRPGAAAESRPSAGVTSASAAPKTSAPKPSPSASASVAPPVEPTEVFALSAPESGASSVQHGCS